MPVRYTEHAERRMRERGIRRSWVEEALEDPDRVVQARAGRSQAIKSMGDDTFSVIFVREGSDVVVITVYWGE